MLNVVKYMHNATTTAILMDDGIALMRENIRRSHPQANVAQIDALLNSWLCRKQDPIVGDTSGPVRIRERAP